LRGLPWAALAAPQGQERRFRREGVPCRAIVQRTGDLFTISSAQETTRQIAQLLKHRLEAAEHWPLEQFDFLPKEGQVWALDRYYREWCQEPEVQLLEDAVWRRQPSNDAFNRTKASYFKTTLFERCRRPLAVSAEPPRNALPSGLPNPGPSEYRPPTPAPRSMIASPAV